MLTQRSNSNTVYLTVKHFSLWREVKTPVAGSETIQVTNPQTKEVIPKHGFRFDSLTGHVVKAARYDTERKYAKRYFGFKISIADGAENYVLDMPYDSQILRRFLRVVPNIDWALPLSITVFKSKKEQPNDPDSTGVWFQQRGETVKPYFTREDPHGMPAATQDKVSLAWDFKPQHSWLVAKFIDETIPQIDAVAKAMAPSVGHDADDGQGVDDSDIPPHGNVDEDDLPF